jgi:uncharacterized phage-associated protein
MFKVTANVVKDADSSVFNASQSETIEKVIDFYGSYTAQQLSDINHQETPWIEARGELSPAARCDEIITSAAMSEYYSGVPDNNEAV